VSLDRSHTLINGKPGQSQQLFASVGLNLLQQLEHLVSLADVDHGSVDYHRRDHYDTTELYPDSEFHGNLRSGCTQQHTPRISVLASWAALIIHPTASPGVVGAQFGI
jgi:hypothetical protein